MRQRGRRPLGLDGGASRILPPSSLRGRRCPSLTDWGLPLPRSRPSLFEWLTHPPHTGRAGPRGARTRAGRGGGHPSAARHGRRRPPLPWPRRPRSRHRLPSLGPAPCGPGAGLRARLALGFGFHSTLRALRRTRGCLCPTSRWFDNESDKRQVTLTLSPSQPSPESFATRLHTRYSSLLGVFRQSRNDLPFSTCKKRTVVKSFVRRALNP